MKLFIASDIHGSALYCQQMLNAYEQEKADKLILLGDILYHGPRNALPDGYNPKKVIELLNPVSNEILCVRGNCDTEVDQMVLDFSVLSDSALIFADGITMIAAHGHKETPKMPCGGILLNGHTHVPSFEEKDGFIRINPGSVSIPKENSQHGYIVFENRIFTWKNLSGEVYREEKI
ncbi:MAG: phosphodiesterase [Clostridia bacterium]|nr:phosphodiesterase [Clostridia bacterium]